MKGDSGTSLVNASNGRSAWAPLKDPLFRSLWTANLISNIGGWMQAVGAVDRGGWFRCAKVPTSGRLLTG